MQKALQTHDSNELRVFFQNPSRYIRRIKKNNFQENQEKTSGLASFEYFFVKFWTVKPNFLAPDARLNLIFNFLKMS